MPVSSLLSQRTKTRILDAFEALGLEVRPSRSPLRYAIVRKDRFGVDPLHDVRAILGRDPRFVIDVGGHVGQTALRFADAFPAARVVTFEPDPENFVTLQRNVANTPRIRAVNAAVGRQSTVSTLHRNRGSQTHSLLGVAEGAQQYVISTDLLERAGDVDVDVVSLDAFLASAGNERPDVVKVDTQGYELEVLGGAGELLAMRPAPLLYVEVSFVPQYAGQPLFTEVYSFLFERGFRLVGLYETGFSTHFYQVGANALFVHESMGARTHERA